MLFGFAVNIVSLALANLLGGLFIIVHNVSDSFIFVHWSFLDMTLFVYILNIICDFADLGTER